MAIFGSVIFAPAAPRSASRAPCARWEGARDGQLRGFHRASLGREPGDLIQRVRVAGDDAPSGEQVVGDRAREGLRDRRMSNRSRLSWLRWRGAPATHVRDVVGEADHGEHAVVALRGRGLHGLRAAPHHAQPVLEGHRAREHQRGVLAEAQPGGARHEATVSGDSALSFHGGETDERGLRERRVVEFLLRAVHADIQRVVP